MFIKRVNRAGKTYTYQIIRGFKTLLAFFISRGTTVSIVKPFSSDIVWFFAENCPISGANIQAYFGGKKLAK